MPKLPVVSGKETIKALQKIGFKSVKQKGSHIKLVRNFPESQYRQVLTIPNHKVLKRGTLRNGILKPINLSVEEFSKLLKK